MQADTDAGTPVEVGVRLSGGSDLPVRVVVGGELGRASVVLAPGSTRGTLELTVPPEDTDQPSRVVPVDIVRVVNARAGRSAQVTIDPPTPERRVGADLPSSRRQMTLRG